MTDYKTLPTEQQKARAKIAAMSNTQLHIAYEMVRSEIDARVPYAPGGKFKSENDYWTAYANGQTVLNMLQDEIDYRNTSEA